MTTLKLIQGDITKLAVDAIVNAANPTLMGGGGVDGVIHRAAGAELQKECRTLYGCATGEAKITQGYQLPAKYVIHTVGPIWRGGKQNEAKLLANCYINTLTVAIQHGIKTVAFPAISCGAYGYPWQEAVEIAVLTTLAFIEKNTEVDTIYFVVYNESLYDIYDNVLKTVQNPLPTT
jgi:O-acetyl-ADP-ribose deacetylase (regulator of RNase III)